jgi:hypothetical protein
METGRLRVCFDPGTVASPWSDKELQRIVVFCSKTTGTPSAVIDSKTETASNKGMELTAYSLR